MTAPTFSRDRNSIATSIYRRGRIFVVAIVLGASISPSPAHAADLRTVALTGQSAPGTTGDTTYSSFGSVLAEGFLYHGIVLNDAGQTAFRANLTGTGVSSTNNQGVWSEGSGSLALVARAGSQAPGAPNGINFRTLPSLEIFMPVLNNAGQTAFYAATSDNGMGFWSEGTGSLTAVARSGQFAAGTTGGVAYSFSNLFDFLETPILNDAGQTSFRSYLIGGNVNNNNKQGIWSEGSGSVKLLARLGSPAPGLSGINHGYSFIAGLNDKGQSTFFSFLSGPTVNSSNERSLMSETTGSLAVMVRTGNQAPGMPAGVTFDQFYNSVSINNSGQAVFLAGLSNQNGLGDSDSIWLDSAGSLQPLAIRGTQVNGFPSGVTYEYFGGWPQLNDVGQAFYFAKFTGPGVDASNDIAMFVTTAQGNETPVIVRGAQAPDAPAGTVFNFGEGLYAAPVLNDAGQFAYMSPLTGTGVDSSNDLGIWASDRTGVHHLIAREGDQLEVAPGDSRTVSALSFVGGSGNSTGWPNAFNNVGQVAFWASFTDGTQGVFVSNKVAGIPGDFNFDGTVDAADYVTWRKGLGTLYSQSHLDIWRSHFGQSAGSGAAGYALGASAESPPAVPEPTSIVLAVLLASAIYPATTRVRTR